MQKKTYWKRIDEMEENAKKQDGGDQMLLILILKFNKVHILLPLST